MARPSKDGVRPVHGSICTSMAEANDSGNLRHHPRVYTLWVHYSSSGSAVRGFI